MGGQNLFRVVLESMFGIKGAEKLFFYWDYFCLEFSLLFATKYLAAKGEKKEYRAIYDLFLSIKKDLSPASKLELHRAAYEIQDYPLVVALGGPYFQQFTRLLTKPIQALDGYELDKK